MTYSARHSGMRVQEMEPDVQLSDKILDTPNLTMHYTRCCVYVYVQEQCKHSRMEGSIVQETPDEDVCVCVCVCTEDF